MRALSNEGEEALTVGAQPCVCVLEQWQNNASAAGGANTADACKARLAQRKDRKKLFILHI